VQSVAWQPAAAAIRHLAIGVGEFSIDGGWPRPALLPGQRGMYSHTGPRPEIGRSAVTWHEDRHVVAARRAIAELGTVEMRDQVSSPSPTMTLAERRSAEQAWLRHTPIRQRREVMKYIKEGQVHPDADLALRAYRWAKGETEYNIFRSTRAGLWAVLATWWVPGLSQGVFKLRVARRIVEVSERQMPAMREA
jgi:hypothetical protein